MQTEKIIINREQARDLYRAYKKHQHYSEPMDDEIRRAYQLLAQGRLIIKAIESVRLAGLNEAGLPKLALAPATAKSCHLRRVRDGSMVMSPTENFWRQQSRQFRFGAETFSFPPESFPVAQWSERGSRVSQSDHEAILPPVPLHLRPKRGLENYHVLWEAEWHRIPPRDPFLLRRIGKSDMWLVVAMWDLTEVERAALATRISAS